jgi:dTDP-4-amino-4,6-dideoxygalactose transaminase
VYQGGTPVFLDSDASYNIDPNVLETALAQRAAKGKRPRAILVVHLFGQSADLDAIFELGARYDVPVIEDAAEALGTLYKGKQVGALGGPTALGVYSFNGNKIITTTGAAPSSVGTRRGSKRRASGPPRPGIRASATSTASWASTTG